MLESLRLISEEVKCCRVEVDRTQNAKDEGVKIQDLCILWVSKCDDERLRIVAQGNSDYKGYLSICI